MVRGINAPKPQPHTSHLPPTGSTNTRDQRLTIEAGRVSVAFLRTKGASKGILKWVHDKPSDVPREYIRTDCVVQHLSPATLALVEGRTIAIDAAAWREAAGYPIIRLRVVGEVIADGKGSTAHPTIAFSLSSYTTPQAQMCALTRWAAFALSTWRMMAAWRASTRSSSSAS